ncbi:hypothetical protein VPHD479_0062 [Vibrio phage D479]
MINIATDSSKSTITNIVEDHIQPNAYDVRLAKVFTISDAPFVITEDMKEHRGGKEIIPGEDGFIRLPPGRYDVLFDHKVQIAEGEAGWLIQRSTLNRNACFVTSGLYDSGFNGYVAGCLHVTQGMMITKPGTRLAQFVLTEADTGHAYDGSYGLGKFDETKYDK